MNTMVIQKGDKYFELNDQDNNQYRIFFRVSKNLTPSFSICIIHEISPSKSISYKKMFLLDEFNDLVKNYKKFENIDEIQKELMSNIMNSNINIKTDNNRSIIVNFLLGGNYQLSFKVLIAHEIIESNKLLIKTKEQIKQANNIKNKFGVLSNKLQKCEEVNKNNDERIQKLKDLTTKLYNIFNNRSKIPINNNPPEDILLTKTKEERYRILGIKSDIVHSLNELMYISRWLSSEKVTKLDLLFKGPSSNFDATTFHLTYDNIVPCLILIETTRGVRFGGFTNQTWKGENTYKNDKTAFLFNLDFLEKYPINPQYSGSAILAKTQYFFGFGKGDLIIFDHCNKVICRSDFPVSYVCQNQNCNPKLRLTNYQHEFVVRDIEVFLVSFTMKNY